MLLGAHRQSPRAHSPQVQAGAATQMAAATLGVATETTAAGAPHHQLALAKVAVTEAVAMEAVARAADAGAAAPWRTAWQTSAESRA